MCVGLMYSMVPAVILIEFDEAKMCESSQCLNLYNLQIIQAYSSWGKSYSWSIHT